MILVYLKVEGPVESPGSRFESRELRELRGEGGVSRSQIVENHKESQRFCLHDDHWRRPGQGPYHGGGGVGVPLSTDAYIYIYTYVYCYYYCYHIYIYIYIYVYIAACGAHPSSQLYSSRIANTPMQYECPNGAHAI